MGIAGTHCKDSCRDSAGTRVVMRASAHPHAGGLARVRVSPFRVLQGERRCPLKGKCHNAESDTECQTSHSSALRRGTASPKTRNATLTKSLQKKLLFSQRLHWLVATREKSLARDTCSRLQSRWRDPRKTITRSGASQTCRRRPNSTLAS